MTVHVLTGAGSGIGRRLAERLRDRGDELVLLVRDDERIDRLRPDFPEATFLEADLSRPGSLRGLGEAVTGPVDSLLHVAGASDLSSVAEQDLAPWELLLDVNLTAPAVLTRELLPHVRRARGIVVFVNSGAGLHANPGWSAYAASKFGLRALADSLREEEAPQGVRVTSIFPGRTDTPMQQAVQRQEGREYDGSRFLRPETVVDSVLHVLDLPGDATITDLVIRPAPRPAGS